MKLTPWAGVPERFAQTPTELNAPPAAASASQTGSEPNAIAVAFEMLGEHENGHRSHFFLSLQSFWLVLSHTADALDRRLHKVFLFIRCLVTVLGLLGRRLFRQGDTALFKKKQQNNQKSSTIFSFWWVAVVGEFKPRSCRHVFCLLCHFFFFYLQLLKVLMSILLHQINPSVHQVLHDKNLRPKNLIVLVLSRKKT